MAAVEPHGGRFERDDEGLEEVGVGERPVGREGVAGRDDETPEKFESRDDGRTGMEVRPAPPIDCRMAEREGGRVEPTTISLSLPARLPARELLLSPFTSPPADFDGPVLFPSELDPGANRRLVVL